MENKRELYTFSISKRFIKKGIKKQIELKKEKKELSEYICNLIAQDMYKQNKNNNNKKEIDYDTWLKEYQEEWKKASKNMN